MKKILIIIILFSLHLAHAQKRNNSIIGKWIGTDERSETGGIEFLNNKTAKLLMMGKEMPITEYKVDYSKNPVWIDFIIKRNGQTMTLYGLLEFIDSNTIKWEVFPMVNKRPKSFSGKTQNTSIILKRQ
ncbi:MAG: hypothetical protein V4497_03800 [Bacteroidota bacterium]